jgi:nucleotide-binding universal stress UspA family protein
MNEPILVGVALREDDDAVLALARELAISTGAPLVLAHAYPFQPLIAVPPPEWVQDLQAECEAQLQALDPGAPIVCRAGPSPVRVLHEAAEELDAGLIVVGSSHRGPAGRVLPGGVGERLLHGAPCPVAIAPRGYVRPPAGLRRIGVASGDGPEAAASYALADQLASAGEAAVRTYTVVSAHEPEHEPADTVVLHGDVATELAAISDELDVLVAGSRGYGRMRSRLVGGVTAQLAHTARCPLIVVGRAPRRGEDAAVAHR